MTKKAVNRGEKVECIISLARDMMSSLEGVTIEEIQNKYNVARRTAERMRDTLSNLYPVTTELDDDGKTKRWKILSVKPRELTDLTASDLAELQKAASLLDAENIKSGAKALRNIYSSLKAGLSKNKARIETDLEGLLQADGISMRAGPRLNIPTGIINTLREAILGYRIVDIHYKLRRNGKIVKRKVAPYGFIYGERHYLIAALIGKDYPVPWVLGNIKQAKITKESFVRASDFSLKKYAENSFGIFQEEPFDVEWVFSKYAAEDAAEYMFHPTQKMKRNRNGTLTVTFRAGGALEMAWHLYTWGREVKVIKPADFWKRVESHRGIRF